ncbi:MAG: S1 RNA-binding domain-containing protein [Ruminiclostridium sp.]|nr:S1 RNA-binding domain-containing protein [Ruminiclostridium sp.]MBR2491032.1 S1 RNA-binding domain-containing protein [Ruminiclostridium sp.]
MEISVGAILEGNIKSITKFGAFVSLPGGRSGLVHISEIAHSYVADVKDFLTEGQEVKVKVVSIDEAGRINLSIKKATPPPPRPQNPQRDRQGGGSRPFNKDREGAPRFNKDREGAPRSGGYNNGPRPNSQPRTAPAAAAPQAAGPADFEARLKQFMQMSDSKLSDLRMTEKRSSRRSGHR